MAQHLLAKLENTTANLLKTAELARIYDSENTSNEKNYTDLAKKIFEIKTNVIKSTNAITGSKDSPTVNQFEEKYNDLLKKTPKTINGELKATKIQIKSIFHEAEEPNLPTKLEDDENLDLVMDASQVDYIDPITKTRIKTPVRNKVCGHLYDKTSILELIKINPKVRCPIAGCGNKERVTANQLVLDDKVVKLLLTLT